MSKLKKNKFELEVVRLVKEKREELGLSQSKIADILDVSRGFIGQIETPGNPSVYNLWQLNLLAAEMKCSPRDFIPENAIT
jgi:transcriptional regulator with XRE-family HTH domain